MKTPSLSDAKNRFSEVIASSQGERIVVLKHGKPVALIQGVEGYELSDLLMYADVELWRWAARRQQEAADPARLMSAAEARRELLAPATATRSKRARKKTR